MQEQQEEDKESLNFLLSLSKKCFPSSFSSAYLSTCILGISFSHSFFSREINSILSLPVDLSLLALSVSPLGRKERRIKWRHPLTSLLSLQPTEEEKARRETERKDNEKQRKERRRKENKDTREVLLQIGRPGLGCRNLSEDCKAKIHNKIDPSLLSQLMHACPRNDCQPLSMHTEASLLFYFHALPWQGFGLYSDRGEERTNEESICEGRKKQEMSR